MQSSFSFLVNIAEIFHYTPSEILDMDFVLLMGMIREYNYTCNQRRKEYGKTDDKEEDDGEYIEMPDFDTGKMKRIKKVKTI